MHPRIAEVLAHVETERDNLHATVAAIPAARYAIVPPSGGWTVLGVLEHLAIVEGRVTGNLQKRIAEAREAGLGRETDTTSVLAGMRLERLLDRTNKLNAPEAIRPKGEVDLDAAWAALDRSRAALRAFVADIDGLALRDVTHPHPIFGPLDVYSWIAFVGSHEARHAAQIREIGASLGGA